MSIRRLNACEESWREARNGMAVSRGVDGGGEVRGGPHFAKFRDAGLCTRAYVQKVQDEVLSNFEK
jgi:hypothetical protein